eukprot:125523-Pyramimonas_sp.AAC.1
MRKLRANRMRNAVISLVWSVVGKMSPYPTVERVTEPDAEHKHDFKYVREIVQHDSQGEASIRVSVSAALALHTPRRCMQNIFSRRAA